MGHHHHHHHHHHKSHGLSNCCIALNGICFLITMIAGSVIVGALLRPSMQYIDNWRLLNCTLDTQNITRYCQIDDKCQESTNQIQFPSYFYDNGRRFPYEYDANETPLDDSSAEAPVPNNTCSAPTPNQCFQGSIIFHYQPNNATDDIQSQSLYVNGTYYNAYDFVYHFNGSFHCWVDTHNSSRISVLPIPKYSPGGAIATGILFSFSLICLIILFILISIRCFCKNHHDYQPIYRIQADD
ncbi:hypothetical protein SAMD00019534_058650, partial [Acytostelium subglobosum LB1]|uniref:hypothetical protein n=1 Tax=Acytostelium subglobosum LB1 TaxID=1410327 RepID=UPI000644F2C1